MTKVILQSRLYGSWIERCRTVFQKTLDSLASGLEVKIKIQEQVKHGWIKVDVEGEDETVAINQLRQRFGFIPSSLESLKTPCTLTGYATDVGAVGYGVYVNIGLAGSSSVDVLLPLHVLRSQLADGEKVSLRKITDTYKITDNFPLSLRVTKVEINARKLEAELSDSQITVFEGWVNDSLERILAFGISLEDAEEALRRSMLERDVVGIESLGFFEHSLICKLGTQAPGIISKLGRSLYGIPLHTISPANLWLRKRNTLGSEVLSSL